MNTERTGGRARHHVRVALFGFGRVGRRIATLIAGREGLDIVTVISRSLAGQNARDYVPELAANIGILSDPARALSDTHADVVLHATVPTIAEALEQIMQAVRAGCHVISTCEELAYPWVVHPDAAETIDREARRSNVAVLGTGVNPGFVFDGLVLAALSAAWCPRLISVSRVTDASGFGPMVRDRLGLGLSGPAFEQRVASGGIAGHIGFRESMDLLAAALGVGLRTFEESISPLIADNAGMGVPEGTTAGLLQRAAGACGDTLRFDFRLSLHLRPPALDLDVVDSIGIEETGGRAYEVQVRPASTPLDTAAAQLVNAIPDILASEPGLRTRLDLRGPAAWIAFPRHLAGKGAHTSR